MTCSLLEAWGGRRLFARRATQAASGLAAGLAAGAAALLLDCALELLTGDAVRWHADLVGVYLVTGALAGVFTASLAVILRRRPRLLDLGSSALLLPYLVPVWERLDSSLDQGIAAACLTLASVGAWVLLLRYILRRTAGSWAGAAFLAALTLATALAVNRNLLARPLAPEALATDLAILLTVLALAAATRNLGGRRVGVAMAAVVAVLFASAWLARSAAFDSAFDAAPATGTHAERPPHVILLTVDTLRHDVFQRVVRETPEGARFVRAFAGSAWFDEALASSPWTAPSVATLMTGLLPDEHGYGVRSGDRDRPLVGLAESIPTLAEGLRAAGYRTEAYVANPLLFPGSGIDRGFDVYRALANPGRSLPWMRLFFARRGIRRATRGRVRAVPYLPADGVADRLRGRLPRRNDADARPYFLWIHWMDPHVPYLRHPEWVPDAASKFDRYRGEVRYALRHVTTIVEALAEHGLWQDALVIFASDHGEMFPRDGHAEHREGSSGTLRRAGHGHSLHAEVVRIPLAIRPPGGLEVGLHVDALASLVDLPPTVEEILGVDLGMRPTPSARSLAPWLGTEPPSEAHRALTLAGNEWGPPQRGLRLGRWKLIHFPGSDSNDRLYDTLHDPAEQHDLAARRPEVTKRLLRALGEAWSNMAPAPSAEAGEIDEETRRRLEALGYL